MQQNFTLDLTTISFFNGAPLTKYSFYVRSWESYRFIKVYNTPNMQILRKNYKETK